jgi:hypothetical protein
MIAGLIVGFILGVKFEGYLSKFPIIQMIGFDFDEEKELLIR